MKLKWIALILLTAACASAPSAPAQIDPPFPTPGPVGAAPHVYPVETGWFDGQPIRYYNLGTNTPLNPDDPTRVVADPVWVFATGVNDDGSPIQLEGQDSLFDSAPGDPHYSDLWQAHFVMPSADYAPNSITSLDALIASGMKIEKRAMFVNCPIVPPNSSLADDDRPLKKGWVKGQPVVYFDFGVINAKAGKVYAFVTGFDANGEPQLVPGQHFVFDSTRTLAGYSDFWIVQWVIVETGYKADSIRSVADIKYEIKPSAIVVNYPHK